MTNSQGGWALHPTALRLLSLRLRVADPKVILELGSGESTKVLARHASHSGATVVSLEHDPKWHDATLAGLAGASRFVDLRLAPLVGSPPRYDTTYSDGIDFVLVDGPPALAGGRRGAMVDVWPHLSPKWEVWLDDADRRDERAAADEWAFEQECQVEYRPMGRTVAILSSP